MEKQTKKEKIKAFFKGLMGFILNPHFILCFGIAWIITNGWSYIMLGAGIIWDIGWMKAVAGAYLTFLWLPISPEKIVTFAIAIALLRLIFPKDEKTLGLLKGLYEKAKTKRKQKKNNKIDSEHKD